MYCKSCGKEIHDDAVKCIHCGALTGKTASGTNNVDPNEPANVGLVFLSALIPLVGIILGATNISSGKKRAGKRYLWTGIIAWLIAIIAVTINMVAMLS